MSAEEYRERLKKALVSSYQRSATEHPSLPLMAENQRELTKIFGDIFNLWPPAGDTRYERSKRHKWGNTLEQASRASDETPIPIDTLRAIWTDLSTGRITIAGPWSVVQPTRAEYARRTR